MLEYIITSKTKRSLLRLFLTQPEKSFYLREISRLTGEPVTAARRELEYLEKAGLLESSIQGNQKHYSAVEESPFYPELKKIIETAITLGDFLGARFSGLDEVEIAFIYGAAAKNRKAKKSEINLFVVGDISEYRMRKMVMEMEKETGRRVNYKLMDMETYIDRSKRGRTGIISILVGEKIVLKGDPEGVLREDRGEDVRGDSEADFGRRRRSPAEEGGLRGEEEDFKGDSGRRKRIPWSRYEELMRRVGRRGR